MMIDVRIEDVARAFESATGLAPLGLERIPRGYANVTYLVRTDGGRYLLKITARGPERVERAVRGARRAQEGGIPSPVVKAFDTSGSVIPPFWIQEYLDGEDAFRLWPQLTAAERDGIGRAYGETVAKMHSLPFHDDERTLDVHTRDRFDAILARLTELGEVDEAAVGEVHRTLERQLPLLAQVTPRLTHTDLHLENVLVSLDRPARFVALIDFEQTHGSDPAEDFPKLLWWNFPQWPELREPFYLGY